jgi:hypothetical protein
MTSVFQLYGRPLEDSAALPPLLITGTLPSFAAGTAYEGRLQIVNAIGKCTLEVVESSLPPAAYSFIDNFEEEIVLRWPAYTPPEAPTTNVPNGDFEDGNDGSWRFGSGWSIENGNAETGDYAGLFSSHRGIASIESRRVPYNGETISASVRFQQGPSSTGNLVGRILLIWCDANGNMLPGGEGTSFTAGTLIRGGNDTEWQTSSVTSSSPTAATVAIGFSSNRKRENHPARVDNFVWNHSYLAGSNTDLDLSVTFKVTDSANRVAYWSGNLSEFAYYLTSTPSTVFYFEGATADAHPLGGQYKRELVEYEMGLESLTVDAESLSGTLRSIVLEYEGDFEAVSAEVVPLSGQLKAAVIPYTNGLPEAVTTETVPLSGTYKQVIIPYSNYAVENVTTDTIPLGGSLT